MLIPREQPNQNKEMKSVTSLTPPSTSLSHTKSLTIKGQGRQGKINWFR